MKSSNGSFKRPGTLGSRNTNTSRTRTHGEHLRRRGTIRSTLSLLVTGFDRYLLPVLSIIIPIHLLHFARLLYRAWPDSDLVLQHFGRQLPIASSIILGFALTLFAIDLHTWKKDRSRRRPPFWHKARPGIFDTHRLNNSTVLLIGLGLGAIVLLVAWSISV